LGAPLVCLDEVLSVLSGTLSASELDARLAGADAAVIMKVGRNLEKVRQAVMRAGLLDRAWYVERATMAGERVMPLERVDPASAPYFSMVVIPSRLAPTR
jgi:precorrin-2/cobalt-factor-2 C20-methyltransferase